MIERRIKIAVTGASGFIGRHLVSSLLAADVDLILITRNRSSLSEFAERAEIVELDLAHPPADIFAYLQCPDVLVHLAWGALDDYNSIEHLEQELPLHDAFLRLMVMQGLGSLLVSGTCLEYGKRDGRFTETGIASPQVPYAVAKDRLRLQLQSLKKVCPFNLVWTRLFYMYGEGQSEKSLFSQLRRAVEQGEQGFKMSGGEQRRDYLPIREVAEILASLAIQRNDHGIVNVCSGVPQSVRHLVDGWLSQNNWEIELELGYYPYPVYEAMEFWGDRSKLGACLKSA